MTPDGFRTVTLSLPAASEKSHFGKADFRVRNKVFASLPDAGAWGRQGWTRIAIQTADDPSRLATLAPQGEVTY